MNKRIIIMKVVIVATLLITASVALAAEEEEKPSSNFVIRGGRFMPTGKLKDEGFKPKENVEFMLGHYFAPFFALEGGFHRFRTRFEQETPMYTRHNLWANGLELTSKLILPAGRFELYAGIGIGHYWVVDDWIYITPFATYYDKIEDKIWGYYALAGATIDLFRYVYLGVEGKYVMLPDFKGLDEDITGWSLSLSIGVRFL